MAQFDTVINIPPDIPPFEIESSTQVNLFDGGMLGGSIGSINVGDPGQVNENVEVNVFGGTAGLSLNSGSVANISGGQIRSLTVGFDSVANVDGGNVRRALSSGHLNVSGGAFDIVTAGTNGVVMIDGGIIGGNEVGDGLSANADSTVIVRGGRIVSHFRITSGGKALIRGGHVNDELRVSAGGEVHLRGVEFSIDGVGLESLMPGEAFTIVDRDVTLSGLFADGSPFSLTLNSGFAFQSSSFSPAATLTVTLVPEPTSALLLGPAATGLLFRRRTANR
ncbi:MAG: hypothetical protein AAGF31_12430 [Planctomycetota bacterium]